MIKSNLSFNDRGMSIDMEMGDMHWI